MPALRGMIDVSPDRSVASLFATVVLASTIASTGTLNALASESTVSPSRVVYIAIPGGGGTDVVVVGTSSVGTVDDGAIGKSAITIVSPSTSVTSLGPSHGFRATISSIGMPYASLIDVSVSPVWTR